MADNAKTPAPAQTRPAAAPAAAAATPARPAESKAAAASRVAPLDLSALSFADAPAPVRKSSRSKADNPLTKVLQASWDAVDTRDGSPTKGQLYRDFQNGKGSGKSVTVPRSQAQEIVNLVRYAANDLELGSTIVTNDNPNGTTTITFAAKRRRANRKGSASDSE